MYKLIKNHESIIRNKKRKYNKTNNNYEKMKKYNYLINFSYNGIIYKNTNNHYDYSKINKKIYKTLYNPRFPPYTYIEYYKHGKLHRDGNLPAFIKYDMNGNIFEERYYKNGQLHCDEDIPAWIIRNIHNDLIEKIYYKNGTPIKIE